MAKTTTRRTRARTDEGKFIADDPTTPEVNEAWVEEKVAAEPAAPAPQSVPKSVPKAVQEKTPETVWFQSREKEPSMFPVAGIHPTRNFSNGRLEYEVAASDVERFEKNHFVMNARIVRKV